MEEGALKRAAAFTLWAVTAAAIILGACGKKDAVAASGGAPSMPASREVAVKTGDTAGIVKAVDAAAATITLDHRAIPAVGWPAMTMTFKAAPPGLLTGVKPGDRVRFSVRIEGDRYLVTAIRKP